MFIVGFFIGFAVQRTEVNGITISAANWINIEGEVILLVFLPGLLYLDSYNIDIHLFLQSFWQLITFAFPMVLGGTALTACVAYYIFPYGWSLDLSMTFGAILSATDPVAVAVLLNELGAPPRLKVGLYCIFCCIDDAYFEASNLYIIICINIADAHFWRITTQ
jgi:NhaP-type Na+/H+ or K+/H+ antiporter